MRARTRSRTAALGAVAMVSLLAATACGTRLTKAEIAAAARTTGIAQPGQAPVVVDSTGAAAPAVTGVVAGDGGATAVSGAPDGGAGGGRTGASRLPRAPPGGETMAGPTAAGAGESHAVPGAAPVATGEPQGAKASPVVIGNIGTYSGVVGAIYGSGQAAVQVFAKWANARGGLNGHPIQIITGDDG